MSERPRVCRLLPIPYAVALADAARVADELARKVAIDRAVEQAKRDVPWFFKKGG